MPYLLRQTQTGEILACVQRNIYRLDYYGVKWWEREEEAEAAREDTLAELGYEDAYLWRPLHVEEHRLKLCNVKLKNNPDLVLYMNREGALSVSPRG
ncbi:hypothetical protein O9H85_27055 [Paenibacillus filicis]|uniref:Uncharacterized protein n=1 Tax=Paenibacillus gyeongsangnamensis TaxID=3388067 RepID=A0ABT4QGJ9_9BACL|nr:hypothetical protein [Paenibacillus filicis]MCZ8515994.1 hypothetical protein [Paenibacillus filicis]